MSTSQRQPAPQVIIVKQRSNGCLFWAVAVLLFGWLGVIWWAAWKLLVAAWKLNAWGWRVIWRGCVAGWNASVAMGRWGWREGVRGSRWLTPYAVQAGKTFHARYGVRGWAILGGSVAGVVVVLAIISAFTSR